MQVLQSRQGLVCGFYSLIAFLIFLKCWKFFHLTWRNFPNIWSWLRVVMNYIDCVNHRGREILSAFWCYTESLFNVIDFGDKLLTTFYRYVVKTCIFLLFRETELFISKGSLKESLSRVVYLFCYLIYGYGKSKIIVNN